MLKSEQDLTTSLYYVITLNMHSYVTDCYVTVTATYQWVESQISVELIGE